MVDLDIPCPRCAQKLVLDENTAGQRVVCPVCDALITMPALPARSAQSPVRSAIPAPRVEGEQPRTHGTDAGLAPTPDRPPALAPASTTASNRPRPVLPALRSSDRPLPELTPAPYQPTVPAATAAGPPSAARAELPAPRAAHESTRLRAPLSLEEPQGPSADDVAIAAATPPTATTPTATPPATEPTAQARRPANHPLAGARRLQFQPQGAVTVDPEVKDGWGIGGDESGSGRARGRRLALWATPFAVALVVGVLWQIFNHRGDSAPQAATRRQTNAPGAADEVRQASEAVRRFLATTTIEDRVLWVRHPALTKGRMQSWHTPANPIKPLKVLRFHDRSTEQTIDGTTFLMLVMELDDFTTRAVGVERTEEGFKIDWESFVFWSAVRWDEFLSRQPAEAADFRVTVEIDDYYNFGYNDRTKFFCYKLTDPENWAHCYGYCGLDSEMGMQINRMIRRQRQMGMNVIKAILRLRFDPEQRGHNQVLIEAVVQDGWVAPEP